MKKYDPELDEMTEAVYDADIDETVPVRIMKEKQKKVEELEYVKKLEKEKWEAAYIKTHLILDRYDIAVGRETHKQDEASTGQC